MVADLILDNKTLEGFSYITLVEPPEKNEV